MTTLYSNKKFTISLFVVLIISIVTMRFFDAPLKNDICKIGIVSFELAKDVHASENILNSWDKKAKVSAGLSLGFDFLFLLVYSSFLGLLLFNITKTLSKNHILGKIGTSLGFTIYVAAFFDVIENIALIQLLLGDLNQMWASTAYYFASAKFIIILICISYILMGWINLLIQKINN